MKSCGHDYAPASMHVVLWAGPQSGHTALRQSHSMVTSDKGYSRKFQIMMSLLEAIPNVDVMTALQPEELASKILFLLPDSGFYDQGVAALSTVTNALRRIIMEYQFEGHEPLRYNQDLYPKERVNEVEQCVREAWSWLVAQGLLVSIGTGHEYYMLSRRASSFVDESKFVDYATARLLQRPMLHHSIAKAAWQSFMRGEYATAVFQTMRQVEIAVREAAGFAPGEHGVPMIRRAFNKGGPLADPRAEPAEVEALSSLFAGAVGTYKNPHSHRHVLMESAREAAEIVMMGSHLLRVVDDRAAMKAERDGL